MFTEEYNKMLTNFIPMNRDVAKKLTKRINEKVGMSSEIYDNIYAIMIVQSNGQLHIEPLCVERFMDFVQIDFGYTDNLYLKTKQPDLKLYFRKGKLYVRNFVYYKVKGFINYTYILVK